MILMTDTNIDDIVAKAKEQVANGNAANNSIPEPSVAPKVEQPLNKPASKTSNEGPSAIHQQTTKVVNKVSNATNTNRNTSKVIIGLVAAVVVIAVIVVLLFTFVFSGTYVSGNVKSIGLYQTKSTKEIDATENPAKEANKFKVGEPIIAKLGYAFSGTDSQTYTYSVKQTSKTDDNGDVVIVRKGSLPVTGNDDGATQDRYISIVSSERTSLEAGSYAFELTQNDEILARFQFTIEAN
jgi:hypothetical protein